MRSRVVLTVVIAVVVLGAVGPVTPVEARQDSSIAETDISLTLNTTRGEPLTGGLTKRIANDQPVQVTISGTGLGSGEHSVRLIEDDLFGLTTVDTVTLDGASDTAILTLQYSELEPLISNDAGAADLEAQWVEEGEVLASSSEQNLGIAETTTYIRSLPDTASEGETVTVSIYGWSEHDTPNLKLMEDDGLLGTNEQIATINADSSGSKYTANVTFVPSTAPEEDSTVEVYLVPVSESNGPQTRIHEIEIVENAAPRAVAGTNQTVAEGATVTLNGSGSRDPDGDSLSYSWVQTGGPSVTLRSADTAMPEFTAPTVDSTTEIEFELTVSDAHGSSDSGSVTVVVNSSGSSNGNDSRSEVDVRVKHDTVVEPESQTTITVDSIDGAEIKVGGMTDDWVVNSTDPAGLTTFPNPSTTPYESVSNDTWGHLFGTVGNNTFELVVTAPNETGTYNFAAEAAHNGTTAVQNFTIEVTTRSEHESGVSQRAFDAAAGDDGTLERSDVLDVVSVYLRGETINGVEFTRPDILKLVAYYIR